MTKQAKGFDQGFCDWDPAMSGLTKGRYRLEISERAVAEMKAGAMPPAEMSVAPVAPARGVHQLAADWEVLPGGTRRQTGVHWITPTRLDVENHYARDRFGDRAAERAEERAGRRGRLATDAEREIEMRKVEAFSPSQVAMARRYAELVEKKAASGIKCGRLEGGSGGGGGGIYTEAFMDTVRELDRLEAAIGTGVALSPRRHMDRDNARRPITVRAAVDMLVLEQRTISAILKRHGWEPKGANRKLVRDAIRGALDRMVH